MTESRDGCILSVWSALVRMAELAARQEEAEKEAKRLLGEYDAECAQVLEAVPALSIEATVNAIRLLGSPVSTGGASTGNPAADPPADASAGDPLSIPAFLRRGEGAGEEGPAKLVHDADAVARGSAP